MKKFSMLNRFILTEQKMKKERIAELKRLARTNSYNKGEYTCQK